MNGCKKKTKWLIDSLSYSRTATVETAIQEAAE